MGKRAREMLTAEEILERVERESAKRRAQRERARERLLTVGLPRRACYIPKDRMHEDGWRFISSFLDPIRRSDCKWTEERFKTAQTTWMRQIQESSLDFDFLCRLLYNTGRLTQCDGCPVITHRTNPATDAEKEAFHNSYKGKVVTFIAEHLRSRMKQGSKEWRREHERYFRYYKDDFGVEL